MQQTARTIESAHFICYLVRRIVGLTGPILSATHTIIGDISGIKIIATGKAIREIGRLKKLYGKGRWRKLKGVATVRLQDGTMCKAELHWYEAHGIGRREIKIKHILSE